MICFIVKVLLKNSDDLDLLVCDLDIVIRLWEVRRKGIVWV